MLNNREIYKNIKKCELNELIAYISVNSMYAYQKNRY